LRFDLLAGRHALGIALACERSIGVLCRRLRLADREDERPRDRHDEAGDDAEGDRKTFDEHLEVIGTKTLLP